MNKKSYHMAERLRTASMLTFIGGFMDAYSFKTQGGHFSGMQTGNMIYLMMELAAGRYWSALSYLLPIVCFIIGAMFTYFIRKKITEKRGPWYLTSATLMFIGIFIIGLSSMTAYNQLTVALLAFFAAIQAETFKHVRGTPYANIMMTGNLKSFSVFLAQGISERDPIYLRKARNTFLVVLAFAFGAYLSAKLSNYMGNNTIFLLMIPFGVLMCILYGEEKK